MLWRACKTDGSTDFPAVSQIGCPDPPGGGQFKVIMEPAPPDDGTLLRRWLDRGEEASFRELVERYNGLVYHSALRTAGNPGIAAEGAQLTFIVLASRARQLVTRSSLAGWLHQTAVLQTRNLLRKQRREDLKRQSYTAMTDPSEEIQAWREMAPVLDDALAALPESDREAILLRFYRSLTFPEIAAAVGIASDAARKRVDRAVERLRVQLGRRGCHVGTAACLGALGQLGIEAKAGVLSAAVLSSKAIGAAALSTGITATTIAIIMTKKATITAGAALLLAGVGAIAIINNNPAVPEAETPSANTRPASTRAERSSGPSSPAADSIARARPRDPAENPDLVTTYGEARTNLSKFVTGNVLDLMDTVIEMGEMANSGGLANAFGGQRGGLQMGLGRELVQNLDLSEDQQTKAQELLKEFQKRELERAKTTVETLRKDPESMMRIMLAGDAYARGEITEEAYKAIQATNQADLEGIMNPLDERNFRGGRPLADEAFRTGMIGILEPDQAQTFQSSVASNTQQPNAGSISEMPAMELEKLDKTITSVKTVTSGVRQMMEGFGGLQDLGPLLEQRRQQEEGGN
jgi:RNA polymerase sigma factor (sigma-70 family)